MQIARQFRAPLENARSSGLISCLFFVRKCAPFRRQTGLRGKRCGVGTLGISTVICILGMHRSGTSSLAGCLHEHGLYLGDVVDWAPHNLKGNKENLDLRAINDDVLACSNGAWDKPPRQLRWDDALRQRRDDHISAQHRSNRVWGFKDPRTLLTLPFWLEADVELQFVGTFRHPQSVAKSLMSRPGMAPATPALELWRHYNERLLDYATKVEMPLVCFDWPAERYVDGIGKIAGRLGLKDKPATPCFFDEKLIGARLAPSAHSSIDSELLLIYEALMRLASGA